MSHSIVPKIIRPRVEAGVDHSGERVVIVRCQWAHGIWKELRWAKGGTFWLSIHEPRKHAPAELQLVTWNANGREVERTLSSGGRLSRGRLTQNLLYTTLMAEFGIVAAKTITTGLDLRYQTLLIDEAPP